MLSAHAKVNEVKQDWSLKLKLRAQARRRTSQVAKILALAQDTQHKEQLLYQTSLRRRLGTDPNWWSWNLFASFLNNYVKLENSRNGLRKLKRQKIGEIFN